MEMWIPLISEYGFPIMITLYLLHRIEKKLDLLNESMQQMAINLKRPSFSEQGPAKPLKNNA
ncbi:hypothetical protein BKP35_05175 [Anaerobacillus arseniciselenatis]|uniref:YvrJ family protein n=1 Tax=Anaerobacillus arseniciselenatis TaxID=85682 RepID=A0A1S2LRV5_9BACI|nr:YvrJ family protein [Anaerobacillus arseniciselenatis]OIJ15242.1 hypothetical protein BKP35_05175 [Anaerobacillus arseniciselenatis]